MHVVERSAYLLPVHSERMDDLMLEGPGLDRALRELAHVNRFLGGYSSLLRALRPLLRRARGMHLRFVDLGAGLADVACFLVHAADRHGVHAHVTAVEGNAAAATAARRWVYARLPARLRERVDVRYQDVWDIDDAEGYDVSMASLFLHHFSDGAAAALLRKMAVLGRLGIVVTDLHRHPVAYHGIRGLSSALRASSIFRHDAPLSVLRGFRRSEMLDLAAEAGLSRPRVRWNWAFRWTLSTV